MAAPTLTPTGIRTDLVTRLGAVSPALVPAGHIHDTRTIPLAAGDLPAIIVYSTGCSEDVVSETAPVTRHTERIAIESVVQAATDANLGAAIDTLECGIKRALLTDAEWMSVVRLGSIRADRGRTADTDHRRGSSVLTIEVLWDEQYDPTAALTTDIDGMDIHLHQGESTTIVEIVAGAQP